MCSARQLFWNTTLFESNGWNTTSIARWGWEPNALKTLIDSFREIERRSESLTIMGILAILRHFTLEYWMDDGWYVGRLKEVPGVFSQGESMDELEDNIKDAYQMMMADEETLSRPDVHTKELVVEV